MSLSETKRSHSLDISSDRIRENLESRSLRAFKSSEEYLYAMKEDLAEWLNSLYSLDIRVDNFLEKLETGVILCRHANSVLDNGRKLKKLNACLNIEIPEKNVTFRANVEPKTFQARDNISNFISWCRRMKIHECLLFETDDLVLRKNERSFILCLLEVARKGFQFGITVPLLVQMEQEIDREIESGNNVNKETNLAENESNGTQEMTNDLRQLHQRVVDLLGQCSCPSLYPMIKVADGKYRIGDTKTILFVRILRNHTMVRVGGGWDTLEHYLYKHDPCRCQSMNIKVMFTFKGQRTPKTTRLTYKMSKDGSKTDFLVTYDRAKKSPNSVESSSTSPTLSPANMSRRSSNSSLGNYSMSSPLNSFIIAANSS